MTAPNPPVRNVKYAKIDTSGTDTTLVAAVSGKRIVVLSLFLVATGALTVRFESGTGGTALTGQMALIDSTGFVLPYNEYGWFATAKDELLNIEVSANAVDGSLSYVEMD